METKGNYELLYIVHPDLESSIDKVLGRVRLSIENRGGKVDYEENWGKRKLAYEINKADVGIYILWYFTAPKENIAKIEKDLRLTEEVMRYLLLSYTEPAEKEAPKKEKKETKVTEKKTAPEKKAVKKPAKKAEKKESEKERMEKIDEKLGELLGKEDNEEKGKGKEKK